MIRKTIHIVIAGLLLISAMGITINMHFCHDQLIDFAFNSSAQSCCNINKEGAGISQDGCPGCQDETIVIEPGNDYEVSATAFNFENSHNIDLFLFPALIKSLESIDDPNKNEVPWYKKPPPYQEVILSQIQSYLI